MATTLSYGLQQYPAYFYGVKTSNWVGTTSDLYLPDNFDPCYPVITVGGVTGESTSTFGVDFNYFKLTVYNTVRYYFLNRYELLPSNTIRLYLTEDVTATFQNWLDSTGINYRTQSYMTGVDDISNNIPEFVRIRNDTNVIPYTGSDLFSYKNYTIVIIAGSKSNTVYAMDADSYNTFLSRFWNKTNLEKIKNALGGFDSDPSSFIIGTYHLPINIDEHLVQTEVRIADIDLGFSSYAISNTAIVTGTYGYIDVGVQTYNVSLKYDIEDWRNNPEMNTMKVALPYSGIYDVDFRHFGSHYDASGTYTDSVKSIKVRTTLQMNPWTGDIVYTLDDGTPERLYEFYGNVYTAVPSSTLNYQTSTQMMQLQSNLVSSQYNYTVGSTYANIDTMLNSAVTTLEDRLNATTAGLRNANNAKLGGYAGATGALSGINADSTRFGIGLNALNTGLNMGQSVTSANIAHDFYATQTDIDNQMAFNLLQQQHAYESVKQSAEQLANSTRDVGLYQASQNGVTAQVSGGYGHSLSNTYRNRSPIFIFIRKSYELLATTVKAAAENRMGYNKCIYMTGTPKGYIKALNGTVNVLFNIPISTTKTMPCMTLQEASMIEELYCNGIYNVTSDTSPLT